MNIKFVLSSLSAAVAIVVLSASTPVFAANDAQAHSDSAMSAISDTSITATVKAKYLEDTRFKNSNISVVTTNGVVTLTGTATGSEASNAAGDLAQHVNGVSSVNNQIVTPVVTPSAATKVAEKTRHAAKTTERVVSDTWITTKVKSALLADNLTKGLKISVNTSHHIVALSGAVDSGASIDEAVRVATKIKGVESVDSSALRTEKN
jgi:hyperosmotically inducible protein